MHTKESCRWLSGIDTYNFPCFKDVPIPATHQIFNRYYSKVTTATELSVTEKKCICLLERRVQRELRVTDAQLKAVRHARVDECVMGKYSDVEFMTYCNRSQGIALDFPVVCHKYFSSYYQVEGSKQNGSMYSKRRTFSVGESRCSRYCHACGQVQCRHRLLQSSKELGRFAPYAVA